MKDWVKTVVWVIIGMCAVSAFAGIFELFSFLHRCQYTVISLSIANKIEEFWINNTIPAVILAFAVAVLLVAVLVISIKGGTHAKKTILGLTITATVISLFFVIFPFCVQLLFSREFMSESTSDFNSTSYLYYQQYFSAALSTFIPLLIAAAAELGYFLYNAKKNKPAKADVPAEEAAPAQAEREED